MRYLCDDMRHLICEPFSLEGLHAMAEALNIKRCWFHNGGSGRMKGCFPHYDIPKKRIEEIHAKCEVVDPRVIHGILKEWAQKNNKWPHAVQKEDSRREESGSKADRS